MANLIMTNWRIEDKLPYINLGSAGENNASMVTITVDALIENAQYYLDIGDENGIGLPNTQELTPNINTDDNGVIYTLSMKPMVTWLGKEGIKLLQVRCVYEENDEQICKESNVIHAIVNKNSGFVYKYSIAVFEEYLNKIKLLVGKVINSFNLHSLTDVNIQSPTNNQVLKYNAINQKWENKNSSGGGGASSLTDLDDTNIVSPSNNQFLKYNATTQTWVNGNGGNVVTQGKVVVIGDSYFDGANSYNFADYLTSLGTYEKVSDYAEGGTGFGVTYSDKQSLYTKLQNPQMRADIAEADIIFMHLGGNDILSRMSFVQEPKGTEPDLYKAVKDALAEIYTLNSDVTVYYINGMTIKNTIPMMVLPAISEQPSPLLNVQPTRLDALIALDVISTIHYAFIGSNLNLFVLDVTSSSLINAYNPNDIHPTSDAAQHMFQEIVNGNYIGLFLDYAINDVTNYIYSMSPTLINDYVSIILKAFQYNRISKTESMILNMFLSDNNIVFNTSRFDLTDNELRFMMINTNNDVLYTHTMSTNPISIDSTSKNYKLGTSIFECSSLNDWDSLDADTKALYSHIAIVNDGLYNSNKEQVANYSNAFTASISNGTGGASLKFNDINHNTASGYASSAEGGYCESKEAYAHSEGTGCKALGHSSHAQNNNTIARGKHQTAIGKYNIAQGSANALQDTDYALIIGNGANNENRSDALAVQWDGTIVFANGETLSPSEITQLKALLN